MTSGGLAAVSSSAFAALYSAFGKYDVVHIHAEGPAFFAWLPKMFGKRVVVTVHGIDLRKLDVPKQSFMERPIDCKAGYKHHVTNEYLKHLQNSLMDLCRREFLHQVDLLSPSRTGMTEAEYWAQRRLDEKKQKIETEVFTPNPTSAAILWEVLQPISEDTARLDSCRIRMTAIS